MSPERGKISPDNIKDFSLTETANTFCIIAENDGVTNSELAKLKFGDLFPLSRHTAIREDVEKLKEKGLVESVEKVGLIVTEKGIDVYVGVQAERARTKARRSREIAMIRKNSKIS